MTSADADTGLLAPGWTGSPAAASTGDTAYLQALLDAEAALTRAQAALGLAPAAAGPAVTSAADAAAFDTRSLAERARGGGNPVIPWSRTSRRRSAASTARTSTGARPARTSWTRRRCWSPPAPST